MATVEEGSTKPMKRTSQYPTSGQVVELYYADRPLDARRKAIVRWITIALFTVVFVFAAYVFYIRKMPPPLPQLEVESFSLMPMPIKAAKTNASSIWRWDIGYFIQDPKDNMDVSYNGVSIEVLYKQESVGAREVHGFYQKNGVRDSKHLIFTTFVGLEEDSPSNRVSNKIFADRMKQNVLTFDVKIHVSATFRNVWSNVNTDQHKIVGYCKNLSIDYTDDPEDGRLMGGTQPCKSIVED